jgi:amino acid transporter
MQSAFRVTSWTGNTWNASVIGYSNPIRQLPVLSSVMLAIWFTLIMIAWMRLRRHEWRPTLEMASTSMIAVIPVVSVGLLGIAPLSELTGLECGGACALMFVAMLLRLNHYTASHASHQQHVHAT